MEIWPGKILISYHQFISPSALIVLFQDKNGQHSLTSVERPSYLPPDFVNVWRHPRLVVYIYLRLMHAFASIVHSDSSDDLTVCFEVLSCFLDHPRLIQPRRCYCIRLEKMFSCFASIKPLSGSRKSFQWKLLSNIPWMAPDGMSHRCPTAAPSDNFFKILAGIIENYPYGNVCLCRIIMNACNNNKNNNFISAPNIDLHNTKK